LYTEIGFNYELREGNYELRRRNYKFKKQMEKLKWIFIITFLVKVSYAQENATHKPSEKIAHQKTVGQQSEAYYKQEIVSDPNNAINYYNLGLYYSSLYQFDDAEMQYNKAIELDSNFGLAYTSLASLLLASGQMERAIVACEKAMQMDTLSALNYLNMGVMQFQNVKFEEAEQIFLKGIQLDSMNAEIYLNLGTLLMQVNRQTEAIVYLKKALLLNPNDPGSPHSLASIYSAQDNIEDGFNYLEIALINGISFYDMLQVDVTLTSLRKNTTRWKTLMKKYFPKKAK